MPEEITLRELFYKTLDADVNAFIRSIGEVIKFLGFWIAIGIIVGICVIGFMFIWNKCKRK